MNLTSVLKRVSGAGSFSLAFQSSELEREEHTMNISLMNVTTRTKMENQTLNTVQCHCSKIGQAALKRRQTLCRWLGTEHSSQLLQLHRRYCYRQRSGVFEAIVVAVGETWLAETVVGDSAERGNRRAARTVEAAAVGNPAETGN